MNQTQVGSYSDSRSSKGSSVKVNTEESTIEEESNSMMNPHFMKLTEIDTPFIYHNFDKVDYDLRENEEEEYAIHDSRNDYKISFIKQIGLESNNKLQNQVVNTNRFAT